MRPLQHHQRCQVTRRKRLFPEGSQRLSEQLCRQPERTALVQNVLWRGQEVGINQGCCPRISGGQTDAAGARRTKRPTVCLKPVVRQDVQLPNDQARVDVQLDVWIPLAVHNGSAAA